MAGLSDKEALVLQALVSGGEMYGAALVRDSAGQLKRGTIYVTLQRMEGKGLVESREEDATLDHIGLPRRLYKATGLGQQILAHWQASVRAMDFALGKGHPAW